MRKRLAIIIARISDEKQEDGYSLDAQVKHGKKYCDDNYLDVIQSYKLVETASKPGRRTKFDEIVQFIRKNTRNSSEPLHLVVEKPDRLTRNFTNREQLEILLEAGKLIIHYYKDRRILDSNASPAEIFQENMMTSVSKYYSKNLARESKKGMKEKASQGWYPGRAPLGYCNIRTGLPNKHGRAGARIAPDDRTKAAAQRIFELRATTNLSYGEIAKTIRDENLIPPGRYNGLCKSSVEYILQNPFYTGQYKWDGEWYKGQHEIIIPLKFLDAIAEKKGTRGSARPRGLFSGFLICAFKGCGCNVIYDPKTKVLKSNGETRTYNYYHCTDGKAVHRYSNEKQANVTEEHLFKEFSRAVGAISISEKRADQIARALRIAHEKTVFEQKRTMDKYRQAARDLERREDDLYKHLDDKIIDSETYNRQIRHVREERKYYEVLLEQNQVALTTAFYQTSDDILELAKSAETLWKERSPLERIELLNDILSNRLLNGVTVEYELKKPFKVLAEMNQKDDWCPGPDLNRHARYSRSSGF